MFTVNVFCYVYNVKTVKVVVRFFENLAQGLGLRFLLCHPAVWMVPVYHQGVIGDHASHITPLCAVSMEMYATTRTSLMGPGSQVELNLTF